MNRRTFLSATPASIVTLASLKAPLFVPVDWMYAVDEPIESPWDGWGVRECEMCGDSGITDICDKPFEEPRQFFLTTDEYENCVCEHCIGDYLSEEA